MKFDGMSVREAATAIIDSHDDDSTLTNGDLEDQIVAACEHFLKAAKNDACGGSK